MARPADAASLSALGLSALGVVFGDIGTSPSLHIKTVLGLTGGAPDSVVTLGVLSLVVWTLIVVTTIKYVAVAMRVDNDGEGGILALMSLLGVKRQHRPIIIAFGLFGAALIYGDGAITPAISVLSALEGLDIIFPAFAPYVLPVSVLISWRCSPSSPRGLRGSAGRSDRSWRYGSRRSRCSGSGVSPGILRCFLRSTPGMGSAISSPAEVVDFSSSEASSCA